jgi:hypothetical protein
MSRTRTRVARGLAALHGLPSGFGDATWDPDRAETELAEVGRWLEDFHPYSRPGGYFPGVISETGAMRR